MAAVMVTGSIRRWMAEVMSEPFGREGLHLSKLAMPCSLIFAYPVERLPLLEAIGRVTAEALFAPEAVPGFRASILDGYAVSDADEPPPSSQWQLVGLSAPGAPYQGVLAQGQAVRILTGAPLPAGAQRVLAQELIQPHGDQRITLAVPAGSKLWVRGPEEETAAAQGCWPPLAIGTCCAGTLASAAFGVPVRAVPRPLLVTGDELVPAGQPRPQGDLGEQWHLLAALLRDFVTGESAAGSGR